ncbi:MAG TPA: hypothetical protein VFX33_08840 [Actinomycetales bacterium]|nr:hypothetical protein [Actinomycetales bacterium]
MAIPIDQREQPQRVPAQRQVALDDLAPSAPPTAPSAPKTAGAPVLAVRAPTAPMPTDVILGVGAVALSAAARAIDLAVLPGRVAAKRMPIPGFVRARASRAWWTAGRLGEQRRTVIGRRLTTFLDAAVPYVVQEAMSRLDVADLVAAFVDLDRIAEGLDLDAAVARVDVERVVDRVDLDRVAQRLDIQQILDRVDLDRVVARVDLDGAAARLDVDPIIERVDLVGLARYIVDAIDLPELIRSSTGSMTSEVVHGVRAQSADADEAVQRVVDRVLRRRSRRGERTPGQHTPRQSKPGR